MTLLLGLVSPCSAATWIVGAFGADFDTIQGAIDAATSGDTISVLPGTYDESIDFSGKDLLVASDSGTDLTSIRADEGQPAVYFGTGESSAARLEGFTIQADEVDAVSVVGSDPTLVDLVILEDGYYDAPGGALAVVGGSPTVTACSIDGGLSITAGATVSLETSTLSTIELTVSGTGTTLIAADIALDGHYVYLEDEAAVIVSDSAFEFAVLQTAIGTSFSVIGGTWAGETDIAGSFRAEDLTFDEHGLGLEGGDAVLRDVDFDGVYLGVDVSGGSLDAEGVTFRGGADPEGTYQGIWGQASDVRVVSSTFTGLHVTNINDEDAAGILIYWGSLEVEGCTFTDNQGGGHDVASPSIVVEEADVVLRDTVFVGYGGIRDIADAEVWVSNESNSYPWAFTCDGCEFPSSGQEYSLGPLWVEGAETVEVVDSSFSHPDHPRFVAESVTVRDSATTSTTLEVYSEELVVTDSVFDGGSLWATSTSVVVDGCTFTDTASGSALAVSGQLALSDSTFTGNSAANGGAVYVYGALSVVRTDFCGNVATGDGGAIYLNGTEAGSRIEGTLFRGGVAERGGAIAVRGEGVDIVNTTFVDNEATQGGHLAFTSVTAMALVQDSILAYAAAGDAVWADAASDDGVAFGYNDFWENVAEDAGGSIDASTLALYPNYFVDPGFASSPVGCDADLTLSADSALVDAGSGVDRDGSTSDIGAYGGEAPFAYDGDGDGAGYADDCDDGDADAYPGNEETWYDGIDGDCAGDDDYDADADGQRGEEVGGPDCDDADPAVGVGQPDEGGDGIDQDCDGVDGVQEEDTDVQVDTAMDSGEPDTSTTDTDTGLTQDRDSEESAREERDRGCGCSSAGDAGQGRLLLALLVGTVARRRRAGALGASS